MKYINAEYIESGTFVSGEEDCYNLGLRNDTDVVVIKKSDFDKILSVQIMIDGKMESVYLKYAECEEEN